MLVVLTAAGLPCVAAAEADAAPASLTLDAVVVKPANPGPEVLCKLRVRIRNHGSEVASRLAFAVRVDGRALPVYDTEVFIEDIAPDTAVELEMHNFWSSDSVRPFPANAKLTVEVTLLEAWWVRVEEKDGVVEQTPLGEVAGLPVSRTASLGGRQ